MAVLALCLVVTATTAACGADSGADDGRAAADTTAAAAPGDIGPAAPAADLRLAVDGEGFRLVDASTGSTRPLGFGSSDSAVRAALEATLGAGPVASGEAYDCAIRYEQWEPGLTTWFADGEFVGWTVRDEGESLTTMSGIGVGSTRGELESAYTIEVIPSTLGVEFIAGGLAGLLDGDGADSRITHLWAGVTCIAR